MYHLLKLIMQITVKVFFRSITIKNKALIPAKGPLILVANHPGTFLDPIVIATLLNRKVFFLAKGELFKGKLISAILRGLYMIPVYRKQDDPALMGRNEDTFRKCYEHLEKGGAILIFPEGTSVTERKLRPVKTGAARIALGAEARNNFLLNVSVVSIGLNYTNPHKFNKDLFVNIAPPLHAKEFEELYILDTFKASGEFTEAIRKQLESLIIAIQDQHCDDLVKKVELLYKSKRLKELGFGKNDQEADFELTKKIAEVVQHYVETDPSRATAMNNRIDDYLRRLENLGLDDEVLAKKQSRKSLIRSSLRAYLIILFGFPLYLYGLLTNWLPFELPAWIAKKVTRTIEYRGPIGMVLGIFTFSTYYALLLRYCWLYSESIGITVIAGLSMPLAGFFAYWYYHSLEELKAKWILMVLFYKKSSLIASLIQLRKELLADFVKVREEYYKLKVKS